MHIAFRLDATAALGLGHLKRCLALAAALQQPGTQLALCGHCDHDAAPALAARLGLPWLPLPADAASPQADAAAMLQALPWRPDIVVVDHYGLDARWHAALRSACGARIVAIDDLADRPLAVDLVIDPNPAVDHAAKYRAVLTTPAAVCGGPNYALLDAVYTRHAPAAWRARPQHIGIFMGGTDPQQHSAWVLRVLRQDVGWTGTVCIASTSANPQLDALRRAARAGNATLLLDQPDLADFHAACDLQIGAGGGALWERCCLGVPTIALICADNQRLSIPLAAQAGAVRGLEAIGQTAQQAQALADALRELIEGPGQRQALREQAQALVDGQGAPRAALRLRALLHAGAEAPLRLRPARPADAERLLAWRNDAQTRAASHHGEPVALADHLAWLEGSLAKPLRVLWIACRGDVPVGTVRADHDPASGHTTLSWTVAPEQRGSGVGRQMVQLAAQGLSGALHAEVKAGNAASARIAEAAGLQLAERVGDTLHYRRPAMAAPPRASSR